MLEQVKPEPILVPALCSASYCAATATELWYEIPLCSRCRNNIAGQVMDRIARDIARADDDGWVYIAEIQRADIPILKIGYSGYGNLNRRMRDLEKEQGGKVTVLSVEPGGRRREAALHTHFRTYRLPGLGERFIDAPVIREYATETGIANDAQTELNGLKSAA
jgi:Meiotically up-regulated gene 113